MRTLLVFLACGALAACGAPGSRYRLPGLDAGFRDLGTGVAWVADTAVGDARDLGTGLGRLGTWAAEDAARTARNVAGAPGWFADQAARDAGDLARTTGLLAGDLERDLRIGRDLVAGAPGFVAREVREGSAGLASFFEGEYSRARDDLRSIPSQALWLLDMGLR